MTDEEFVRMYDEHMPRILGYCAFRLGSRHDAEDVTAETFARLLTGRGPDSAQRSVAWLFTVARNLCTDHQRRAKRTGAMPETLVEPSFELVWTDPTLVDALRALSPRQQTVVYLRAVEDLPFARIAQLLHGHEAAIKMQYHRAVRRMRRELEEVQACSDSETEPT